MRNGSFVSAGVVAVLLLASPLEARQRAATTQGRAADDTRLVAAAKRHDVAALRQLLAAGAGARVNTVDAEGMTPLLWAVHHADADLVRRLLQAGADANKANRYGVSPLHAAATQADLPIVLALLNAGASPAATFGAGETPLMTAARTGNAEIVRALIAAGADVNATEQSEGQTALMWAAAENHAAVVEVLVEAGANVNARTINHDFQKLTPKPGNTIMERPLGALTALHLAARQGALEAADVLVRRGAELQAVDPAHNFTPLLTAILNGHYDLAAMLIDKGADVNDGSVYLAVEMRNLDKYTNRPNPPEKDRTLTAFDVLARLLAKGADVNAPLTKTIPQIQTQGRIRVTAGASPLHRAMKSVDLDAAKLLLKHAANPSLAAKDGTTPLMLLAGTQPTRGEEEEVTDAGTRADPLDGIRLLLEAGVDVNGADPAGNTALHMAAARHADAVIQLLAEKGARVDLKNAQGNTPIDIALGAPLRGRGRGADAGGMAVPAAARRTPTPAGEATAALLRKLAGTPSTN